MIVQHGWVIKNIEFKQPTILNSWQWILQRQKRNVEYHVSIVYVHTADMIWQDDNSKYNDDVQSIWNSTDLFFNNNLLMKESMGFDSIDCTLSL